MKHSLQTEQNAQNQKGSKMPNPTITDTKRPSQSQLNRAESRKVSELANLDCPSKFTNIEVLQGKASYVEALEYVEFLRKHDQFPNRTLSNMQNAMTYGEKWNQSAMTRALSLCDGAIIVIKSSKIFNKSEMQILISGLTGKGTTRKFRESCKPC